MPTWLTDILKDQSFLNALGAGVGGFVGVVIFFLVRLGIEKLRSRSITIRVYSCAHAQNIGDTTEYEGQLMHHHGRPVDDPSELSRIGREQPVWEWTRTPCGRFAGTSVIYGPYTTDFSEPGEYEIVYTLRALGLSVRSQLSHDPIILELDVSRTTAEYFPTANGIARFDSVPVIARHFVRASDLAGGDWVHIPLRFYASGEGVWEYRIHAYDGTSKPDHIQHFGQNMRIFFDSISIKRVRKMSLPWE